MRKSVVVEVLRTIGGALILGVLVWYISRNEITRELEAEALIRITNAEDCRVQTDSGLPPRARVALTGPIPALERLRDAFERQAIVGKVRLTDAQRQAGGVVAVPITESTFGPLPDPRVRMRVLDREIRLNVTPMDTRVMPVRLDTDLDPSRYRLISPPSNVRVRGPRAVLAQLKEVKTERLLLSPFLEAGLSAVQQTVGIAAEQEGGRIETNDRVYVSLVFEDETVERTFESVPVGVLLTDPAFPYQATIVKEEHRTARVVVKGPRSVLENDPKIGSRILVFVAVGSARETPPREAPYLLDRQINLPEGVRLVAISGPDKVDVDIKERRAPEPTPP